MRPRTLEFPLPRRAPCASCAEALHQRLSAHPAIQGVTIDFAADRVRIEADEEKAPVSDIGRIVYETLSESDDAARQAADRHVHQERRPAEAPPTPTPSLHVHEEAQRLQENARRNRRRLGFVLAVGMVIMAIEVAGGLAANSLVLLADAAHYATDLVALALAFAAVGWGMRPATTRKTFGFQRAEVVAAFLQAIALWAVSVWLLWEAFGRLRNPPDVEGPVVMAVGAVTLVVNVFLARALHGGGHNLNMRAAYLHILSDVLGSAAALVAGALIYFFDWRIADPLLTVGIALLIIVYAWRLTHQTIHILLEGAPQHVNPAIVAQRLRGIDQVQDVHDLHVWTLTSGVDSLSAHVVLEAPVRDDRVAHAIHDVVRRDFKIHHITIQLEDPGCPCDTLQHSLPEGGAGLSH